MTCVSTTSATETESPYQLVVKASELNRLWGRRGWVPRSYVRTAFGSPTPEEFDKMVEEKAQLQAKVEEQAAMIEQLNAKVRFMTRHVDLVTVGSVG